MLNQGNSRHYTKMWHPRLEHIQLVSQFSHGVIYALQLCHSYDYMTIHDYNLILNIIMCAIDLV